MSELMAACVEVWASDPEALRYHGSGYVALVYGSLWYRFIFRVAPLDYSWADSVATAIAGQA